MKTYKVIKGRVIDVNGNIVRKGGEAQLEADRAKFYSHRIEEKKPKSDLPDDFPYADKFSKKGLNLSDFEGKSIEELQEIKGVGEKTAEDIHGFFNEGSEEEESEGEESEEEESESES